MRSFSGCAFFRGIDCRSAPAERLALAINIALERQIVIPQFGLFEAPACRLHGMAKAWDRYGHLHAALIYRKFTLMVAQPLVEEMSGGTAGAMILGLAGLRQRAKLFLRIEEVRREASPPPQHLSCIRRFRSG